MAKHEEYEFRVLRKEKEDILQYRIRTLYTDPFVEIIAGSWKNVPIVEEE